MNFIAEWFAIGGKKFDSASHIPPQKLVMPTTTL